MTVDKVTYPLGTGTLTLDKVIAQANEAKTSQRTGKTDTAEAPATDSVEFSTQAKDLQETEKILRFALEKLESFDDVRQEKLGDIKDRVDQGFYFDSDIDEAVSERIFSNQDIAREARSRLEVRQQLDNLHEMDAQSTQEIDSDKIQAYKDRIASGYYNQPEVIEATADKLIETLS